MKKQMGKGRGAALFAALFFAALALPFPLWAVFGGKLDTQNRENRVFAQFPQPGAVSPADFPAAFGNWLADNAPFRNQLMTANAALNWRLFGVIDSDVTLAGKDGWMFYRNASDSASLDDYQGINLYTAEQMAQIAQDLAALKTALEKRGCALAVLVAPNKEPVYGRYMPRWIPVVNPVGRIDALASYIEENTSVPFVWPKDGLRALSETQQVYYRYDTHWNGAGAAYAAALLLDRLEVSAPRADSLKYRLSESAPLYDLANLSATWRLVSADASWQAANWPDTGVQLVSEDEEGYYGVYRSGASNPQKLLMLCDSFGLAMRVPLASCFAQSAFVHINAFNEDTIDKRQPDVFVLEISQRFSDRLLDYLPRLVSWAQD